jgi:ubiquitin carboxyl-terminal hydrolase 9/24
MIEAYIPLRLIALAARDRLALVLKESFPGASVSPEVANTQMRAESNPTHLMPMTNNQVMDINNSRNPGTAEVSVILETVVCFLGLSGVIHAPLVRESEDLVRGRQRYILCEGAMKALSTVFHESCIPGNPGMGQREIEAYLRRCSVDTGTGSTQKILEMLSKYPTTGGTDPKGGTYLSLEGFLAYYRDCVQSNDIRLRHDLHSFGFRPDLTRRSREARFFLLGERETHRGQPESVGCDVAETLKDKPVDLGALTNFALHNTVHLYTMAYNVSEPLMEYLVAGAMYKKETDPLTNKTLQSIYSSTTDWHGNEQVAGLTTLLQVVVSIPGDDQYTRIGKVMLSNTKVARNVDFGAGLLQVLRGLHRLRQTHSFNHDLTFTFGRYIHIIKELYNCYPIFKWMNENRNQWSFIEREILESRNSAANQNQPRNDCSTRENEVSTTIDQNTHSDSDMAGINDSEDDEDSQFDTTDNTQLSQNTSPNVRQGPAQLIVEGAGNVAVNGTYMRDTMFEEASHYIREGTWIDERHKFHIFLCNVSNNTKHWYISIVPRGYNPGTSSDIDFYTAPLKPGSKFLPPTTGWVKAQEGNDPPPRISFPTQDEEEDGATSSGAYSDSLGRSNIVEDDTANV